MVGVGTQAHNLPKPHLSPWPDARSRADLTTTILRKHHELNCKAAVEAQTQTPPSHVSHAYVELSTPPCLSDANQEAGEGIISAWLTASQRVFGQNNPGAQQYVPSATPIGAKPFTRHQRNISFFHQETCAKMPLPLILRLIPR